MFHAGYIKLQLPVFHIGYFKNTLQILQARPVPPQSTTLLPVLSLRQACQQGFAPTACSGYVQSGLRSVFALSLHPSSSATYRPGAAHVHGVHAPVPGLHFVGDGWRVHAG